MKKNNNLKGFTLIELLVVIAIIAILAVVVVLTLNPAQLLAQSRDSNRVSDMATLKSAIALYQVDQPAPVMGTAGTVYEAYTGSLPSSTLTGPTSSAINWGYVSGDVLAVSTSTLRGVTGSSSGWLPIPFSMISSGAPFNALPIDPLGTGSNTACALNSAAVCTYTYLSNAAGQYKLAVKMESAKYNYQGGSDVVSPDGGNSTSTYEVGSNVNL